MTRVTFVAEAASVREGSQDLASEPSPDKETQPASKGRTWQPVLPAGPSSSASDGVCRKHQHSCSLHATLLRAKCGGIWEGAQGKQPFTGSGICTMIWYPAGLGKQAPRTQDSGLDFLSEKKKKIKPKKKEDWVHDGF